jgi:hypothetical protein
MSQFDDQIVRCRLLLLLIVPLISPIELLIVFTLLELILFITVDQILSQLRLLLITEDPDLLEASQQFSVVSVGYGLLAEVFIVQLVNYLNDLLLSLLPESPHMIKESLTELKTTIHIILGPYDIVNVVLELEVPAPVFDVLPLLLDLFAFLVVPFHGLDDVQRVLLRDVMRLLVRSLVLVYKGRVALRESPQGVVVFLLAVVFGLQEIFLLLC